MKKYFYLQLKRVGKIFPFILAVTVALLIGLSVILYGVLDTFNRREDNKQFAIAVTGDTDNSYMKWGIAAMQALDETRFSIRFVKMDEADAKTALKKGTISAYVVMPEGFVEKAISGEIEPITYITSAGMEGLSTLFKNEITTLVTDMVVYSQKGAYGLDSALDDNGLADISYQHMNQISLEYTDLIFHRNELCRVDELGISDGLSTPEYYICAITILIFVLIGIPFSMVYIKKDYAFHRLLLSRGYSAQLQLSCEYCTHLFAMFLQAAAIMLIIFAANIIPKVIGSDTLSFHGFLLKIAPIIIMISAFNLFMFELSNNIVSGLLLHFFLAISLCYISGCMYPIYAFPQIIKKIGSCLPTGIARSYLATEFTFDTSLPYLVGIILYTIAFYTLAWLIRYRKTTVVRGCRA